MPDKQPDRELQDSLKDIIASCEREDSEIRLGQIRLWKKYEEFWHGIQYLFWSDRDNNWRSPQDLIGNYEDIEELDELGSFSDRVVDIYRGHAESIIAALSAQIPALRFLPDNADDDSDVLAARTKNKISELVQRHNKAKLIFLRALFFLANNGIVFSYRYKDSDYKYGSYKVPKYGVEEQEQPIYTCETCGYESPTDWLTAKPPDSNTGQQQPFEYDNVAPENNASACPTCGSTDMPKVEMVKQSIPIKLGDTDLPKTRSKIDIFGALHVKVSYYARNQNECSYLLLYGDLGKDVVQFENPDFADQIEGETIIDTYGDETSRFARSEYRASLKTNLVTVIKAWLRPAAFYRENREKVREKLLKKFPDGVRVTLIGRNRIFIESQSESLDSRWEIGQAGLSTFIYSDPFMRPMIQIQEMRNDLVNLILETIRHGIASDFADPTVLNFDTYGRFEAVPGYVYAAKAARPGEPIGNSFYSTSRSTLSQEVGMFLKQLDADAQFSIGSFPSIYGGPAEGKTRTFSEYAASRQMALQRLSIIWNLITDWWVRTISGAVEMYVDIIKEAGEDERFVKYENNNYVNIWLRQTDLDGKTGGVEPEGSETFPVSLSQKKDLIMKLIEMNNEFINQALYLPENARVIQDVMALNEMKLPGELQRIKQTLEFNDLLKDGPIDEQTSTVSPDPDIDDHSLHIETLKNILVDTTGMDIARTNPAGFANCKAHLKQHEIMLVRKMLQPQGGPPNAVPPVQPQPQAQPQTSNNGQ
jgi:hypothetical protein